MRHTWWCCLDLFSKGHLQDFYFADSNGIWLSRHVIEELDDSIPTAVQYGIGKIEGPGFAYNIAKFWQLGESAKPSKMRPQDENDEATRFDVTPANYERFCC